jgi:hypothetical protein
VLPTNAPVTTATPTFAAPASTATTPTTPTTPATTSPVPTPIPAWLLSEIDADTVDLAAHHSGLPLPEVNDLFVSLLREGQSCQPPSLSSWNDWTLRHMFLTAKSTLPATRRSTLHTHLDLLDTQHGPTYTDGSSFYAWSRIEARARQEATIRNLSTSIDLAPAGSQAHQYTRDRHGMPTHVWYASYGSNLHRDRFLTYVRGGKPQGSKRTYQGCRDRTVPQHDIAIRFNGARPHFALHSSVWNGGIAFIDTQKGETATGLGRAYLLTREQFEDVVAQENGLPAGRCALIDYHQVLTNGRLVTGDGPYETLLHIGDHQGAPVLTFTAPFSTLDALGRVRATKHEGPLPGATTTTTKSAKSTRYVRTTKPSAAYVRMIGGGLKETFNMGVVQQADYLRGCPGGDLWTRKELVQTLRGKDKPEPQKPPMATPQAPTTTATPNHSTFVPREPRTKSTVQHSRPAITIDKPPLAAIIDPDTIDPSIKGYYPAVTGQIGTHIRVGSWEKMLRTCLKTAESLAARYENTEAVATRRHTLDAIRKQAASNEERIAELRSKLTHLQSATQPLSS